MVDEPWVDGFVKLRDDIRLVEQFTGTIGEPEDEGEGS